VVQVHLMDLEEEVVLLEVYMGLDGLEELHLIQ